MKTKEGVVWGLTGGIACGKSTVAALLQQLGARIIDCDAVSRELVEPGTPLLAKIAEQFGNNVLDKQGALRRS
ncbi:TPA: dephospho-CoA kinase, partial [bacterium UBP9_UBA11836]|nr:dephospho-CoA kinase [bacterium UBP9_UBA11836]